ncbi:MAG: NADP-dependent malic enzyme [Litoricola sp.]|jgi:malate dehydrogenase (oxaloacetate-decarboxylating)(NADP+)|nr:NADP-dependent malic enzyme [Litorivicinus sp.]MBL6824526.1 NADP-dependent malic enzyme [Litorivicinus sp.]MDA8665161.1 NADP-dependent malic enzyme [Litorivicinaceae bacterium]
MSNDLREAALRYHRAAPAGKLEIAATKPMATQRDLALAYSPGVAYACTEIAEDPSKAAELTARGNMVAVITNGTAVLGLGAIGPLASKPVMEGKAVLFKKFANINSIDIEVDTTDVDRFCDVVSALEPSFGGINLEDIKAPECFEIESRLREKMKIPVFHDDQHGTAIVVGAGMLNAMRYLGKDMGEIKLVCSGAGAAALACLNMLKTLGVKDENIIVCDQHGVLRHDREAPMDQYKARYARETDLTTLKEALVGADAFLGLSVPGVIDQDDVKNMADRPVIFALANPTPEIMPELVKEVRPDALIATGRSDYPNQVNNVLCFPFLFRGALDCGATVINEEMKAACAEAIAAMVHSPPSDEVLSTYQGEQLTFGPEYLIPKPFDPRLIMEIPPGVAKAAEESGVAARPIEDLDAYRDDLSRFVFRSGMLMKPMFEAARSTKRRLVLAEGEGGKMLQACQLIVSEQLADVTLVGRPHVIEDKIKSMGLSIVPGKDFDIVDNLNDDVITSIGEEYHGLMARQGMTPKAAQTRVRANTTVVASMLLRRGDADAMLCGTFGTYGKHLQMVDEIIGRKQESPVVGALTVLILPQGTIFLTDTHVNFDPTAEQLCVLAKLAADEIRRFGIQPKAAFLSHSNFGSSSTPSATKVREATAMFMERYPDIEADGEMHADAALDEKVRLDLLPESKLTGSANLLICPNLDSANIARNLLKVLGNGVTVGPVLLGLEKEAHVATASNSPRGIFNMAAVALANVNRGDD